MITFIPLVTLWLVSFGLLVVCHLGIAAYRKKGWPDLSAIWALCGGVLALYASQQFDSPVYSSAMLFFAGFCGFGAWLFSAYELKASKAAAG
ncbi:MAG: hypothetical protein LW865_01985 [Betaproteobacteria bacterium]|jgi:hypothetical protein|nr:hypothetical protein [Betaproteobacteria bacterium]